MAFNIGKDVVLIISITLPFFFSPAFSTVPPKQWPCVSQGFQGFADYCLI